jgi:hypothetical protein
VETSILAMDGLKILLTTLQDIKDGFDHDVQLTGVVACRFDARTKLSRFILDELKRALPDKVFNTVIRENVRLRECPGSGKSILEYAPDSHAAEDYRSLAKECLVRLGQNERISPQQFQAVSDLREQVESLVRKFSDPGSPQESAAKESPDATAAPLESQAALSPPTEDVIVFDDSAEPFDAAAQPALAEATPHAAQDPAPDDGLALVVPVVEGVGGADISEADDEQPEEQQLEEQPAEAVITAADPPADRFEELSPYANPPVEPEDGSEPESDAEAASDEPVEELPPPEEPLVPIQPVAAAPAPAPDRAMSPAEIARAAEGQAAKAQDFPALRAMLQNLAVERPAPKPAGKPPKKESPWRKMMRAVGVQR